jgi:quercetin dioxygenase-like cupin family protein
MLRARISFFFAVSISGFAFGLVTMAGESGLTVAALSAVCTLWRVAVGCVSSCRSALIVSAGLHGLGRRPVIGAFPGFSGSMNHGKNPVAGESRVDVGRSPCARRTDGRPPLIASRSSNYASCMQNSKRLLIALAAVTLIAAADTGQLTILRAGAGEPVLLPADAVTGTVRIQTTFRNTSPSRVTGALATFEPGARSKWHSHPLGQTLFVTAGTGWVQVEGGPREEMRAGDIVQIPPNVKHWHGATSHSAMSHLAIAESLDGTVVTWFEKVSDEQYEARMK